MAENIHHPSSGKDDNDVEGNPAGTMDNSTVPVKDQSNAFLQMMRRNLFKSSKEKPADQDSLSSDSDNELWYYSESSSDSEDDYYYQRREYCLSDSEDEVAESAIDKPKSVDKKNVLDDYWIMILKLPLNAMVKIVAKRRSKVYGIHMTKRIIARIALLF